MAVMSGGRIVPLGKLRTMQAQNRAANSNTRALRSSPAQYLSLGGILKGIGRTVGGIIPGGQVITTAIDFLGSSKKHPTGCPPGFREGPAGCQPISTLTGPGPSGPTGLPSLPPPADPGGTFNQGGQVVMGGFGLPAALPDIVGVVEDRNGVRQPIRRCGPGMVLGKDNLCYAKQILGRRGQFRKHPAPVRPPVTAEDAKAIRKAASAKNRVQRLAKDVGFSCSTGPRRTKKKG